MAAAVVPEELNENSECIKVVDDALKDLCLNNATYFATDETENGQRLMRAFNSIIQHVTEIEPMVTQISQVVQLYDYDEHTPGNGFRSFLSVVRSSVTCAIQMSRRVCLKRDNILFRKSNIVREVESCNELLGTICLCLHHVLTLTKWCTNGELFVSAEHSPEELLSQAETINQCCFYGRSLGFQFCESMRNTLKFISLSMAVFSEVYYNNGSFLSKATNSVWTSGKYLLDPDTRARRIVNISQNADVDFCKAFWFLNESELMLHLPSLVSTSVAVSHVISIPTEPLQYVRKDGTSVTVPVPSAHVGVQPINLRLISHVAREGMVGVTHKGAALMSRTSAMIVHCHGGGFVAQSSRSHEIYLRDWAQQLGIPIVSVDYSLAPEAPFPRAIEEVFYAYCWAVQNCHLLGSTGETIILAGDSAGGNLLLGAAMKCIELGMRPPDGMFLAYVPVVVEFTVSPARLLCIMDPLLPFGFMMRCLRAYACTEPSAKPQGTSQNGVSSPDTESFEEVTESDLLELQAHKSPISETSDTLTNVSLSSQPVSSGSKPSDLVTVAETDHQVASQKYVSEFLEKYVLESDTDSDGAKIQVLHTAGSNQTMASTAATVESTSADLSFQQRFTGFVGALTDRLTSWKNKKRISRAEMFLDSERQKSLVDEFKFSVPRDPYLSPYFATDDILRGLPPIRILTVELDPCLDDCVSFAKKLKHLGNNVGLDILAGLPHGFLNFAAISKEAHHGSKVCVQRITDLLNLIAERRNSTVGN